MIPFTESIQLAKEINNSELFISHLYEHSEFSSRGGILHITLEVAKLIQFYAKLFYFNEN